MHLALVDLLRCPRPHEPSALVATIDRIRGGSIDEGALGCPVCDARYPIEDGAVVFDADLRARCAARAAAPLPSPDDATRAAALLGLVEPGGVVLLGGAEGRLAAPLRDLVDVSLIVYNPPGRFGAWEDVTPLYAHGLPLAPAALRGAALDAGAGTDLGPVVAALRPGARLVAPAAAPVPAGVRELARDAEAWVAERVAEATATPVPLRRGASSQSPG